VLLWNWAEAASEATLSAPDWSTAHAGCPAFGAPKVCAGAARTVRELCLLTRLTADKG
jgi:hypothetical protein